MTAVVWAIGAGGLAWGLVFGALLHYLVEYKPLLQKHDKLIETLTGMKKQGFVPQFAIEQAVELDPSTDVVEY